MTHNTPLTADSPIPTIAVPLNWWRDLALFKCGRDYTIIDAEFADTIRLADPNGQFCYLENSAGTLDYIGNALPALDSTLYRCWNAVEYRRSIDAQIKRQQARSEFEQKKQSRRDQITSMRRDLIASYVSKQVPQSVAEQLVNDTMSVEVAEIAWKQLNNI